MPERDHEPMTTGGGAQALAGPAKPADQFAWVRTVMALQRTLLAVVRTAVSLIGFGFTVAQFFEKLRSNLDQSTRLLGPELPRNMGLLLILVGVLSLALSTYQYRHAVRAMKSGPFAAMALGDEKSMHKPAYLISFAVLLIGVLAFVSVFARF